MKTNMTIDESIIKGLTIEAINYETGEVQWYELKNGKKFTRMAVLIVLEEICGWSVGDILLFREKGNLVDIMDENHSPLATISKKLAESFRKVHYVKFID